MCCHQRLALTLSDDPLANIEEEEVVAPKEALVRRRLLKGGVKRVAPEDSKGATRSFENEKKVTTIGEARKAF